MVSKAKSCGTVNRLLIFLILAKVFVLDDLLCTFRSNIALFFYVVGGAQENELILKRVLNSLSEAFSEVLRKNIQRKLADESTNNRLVIQSIVQFMGLPQMEFFITHSELDVLIEYSNKS